MLVASKSGVRLRDHDVVVRNVPTLVCCICTEVVNDPVALDVCDHYFCHDCMGTWIAQHSTCPTCRSESKAPPERLRLKNPGQYRNLFGSLKVLCSNTRCAWIGDYPDLGAHLDKNACDIEVSAPPPTIDRSPAIHESNLESRGPIFAGTDRQFDAAGRFVVLRAYVR